MFFCQKNIIRVLSKFFTKAYFRINPAGKPEMPSWKNFVSQLENYFFSVGKLFFSSRAVFWGKSGLFLNYFLLDFVHIETSFDLRIEVKMFDNGWWVLGLDKGTDFWVMSVESVVVPRFSNTSCWTCFSISLRAFTNLSPLPKTETYVFRPTNSVFNVKQNCKALLTVFLTRNKIVKPYKQCF